MKFKTLTHNNTIRENYEYEWPCNCCGLTVSQTLKTKPRGAGKGLRTVIGTYKETDTPTFKIKSIQTKAGPLTIVSKHV